MPILLTIFFYKVYICLRRESKRELRFTISVCDSEITERDYVHSDQHIGAVRNDTLNDANTLTLEAIGQLDIDQERPNPIYASNVVRIDKSCVNQSTSIDDSMCNYTMCCACIPNSGELSGYLVVLYPSGGDFTRSYQNPLDTVEGGREA